ncbi:MAG TPA: hypothetical protein VE870_08600, partial [Bacteroidales bacterium]|nr:hypothetical protein [Bacteroidales bacterium]
MYKYSNLLIDKITGFDIRGELEKVMEKDFWTREKIEAEQAEKFARLSVIAAKSKYYRDFANKPLDHYPVMTRKRFKEHSEDLLTHIRKPYSVQ